MNKLDKLEKEIASVDKEFIKVHARLEGICKIIENIIREETGEEVVCYKDEWDSSDGEIFIRGKNKSTVSKKAGKWIDKNIESLFMRLEHVAFTNWAYFDYD